MPTGIQFREQIAMDSFRSRMNARARAKERERECAEAIRSIESDIRGTQQTYSTHDKWIIENNWNGIQKARNRSDSRAGYCLDRTTHMIANQYATANIGARQVLRHFTQKPFSIQRIPFWSENRAFVKVYNAVCPACLPFSVSCGVRTRCVAACTPHSRVIW